MTLYRLIYFVIVIIVLWIATLSHSESAETDFNFGHNYHDQVREIHTHDSGRIIIIPDLFDETGKGDNTQGVFVKIGLKPGELYRLEQGTLYLKTHDTSKPFPYTITLYTIFSILTLFFLIKKT